MLTPFLYLVLSAPAVPPLHERIDKAIASARPNFAKEAASRSADAEFFRRVHLDLTGSVPAADAVRAFLKDPAASKREAVIDRLLGSPEHARHLATRLDVMLMERRADKHVPTTAWRDFLREAVAANTPWDELARTILSADGADAKARPASRFYLDRDAEPNLVTRDVSRLFLGTNLQCAQCHDHPLVDAYKQEHYYGLFAFVSRTQLFVDPKSKQAVLAEKADGEVTFQSVFDPKKETKKTGPRLPDRDPLKEPAVEKGKEWQVAPAANVRSVPTHSRRAMLAGAITSPDNKAFRRNMANRLWAMMMGRGLVHPLDMDHPDNPPSHPELLDSLAEEFAAMKYDMRAFLRELALSDAYQRSSEPPAGVKEVNPAHFTVAALKPLSPEQLAWSLMQATGLTDTERKAQGAKATEATLYAKLSPNVSAVVKAFGQAPGTPEQYDARLDQALFLSNNPLVRGWLAARPGNLTERLASLKDADAVADELYVSVLARTPDADERKEVADYLARRKANRPAALQELAWALLASAEFRFNH